jgi:hypothetical protein
MGPTAGLAAYKSKALAVYFVVNEQMQEKDAAAG